MWKEKEERKVRRKEGTEHKEEIFFKTPSLIDMILKHFILQPSSVTHNCFRSQGGTDSVVESTTKLMLIFFLSVRIRKCASLSI